MNQLIQPFSRLKEITKKYFALFFWFMLFFFAVSYHPRFFLAQLMNGIGMAVSLFSLMLTIISLKQNPAKSVLYGRPMNGFFVLFVVFLMMLCTGIFIPEGFFAGWCFIMLLANALFGFFEVFRWLRYRIFHIRRKNAASLNVQPQKTPSSRPAAKPIHIHPVYQTYLDQLALHLRDLQEREASVSVFLDSFFAGSSISKSRYVSVIRNASHVLEGNYENALRAAGMFGNGAPTAEREEIMARYVSDSKEVMDKIEKIIDQLIYVEQKDTLADGSVLDALLDDLAATTAYYQKSGF